MSDGPSDAAACRGLGTSLELAAHDLKLAIRRAEAGHRGWSVDVLVVVNDVLKGSGWRLVKYREPKILEGP